MPLIRLTNLSTGESQRFEIAEVKIGRHPDLSLCISGPGSEVVSTTHARLVVQEGKWWLEDLGSRNGTYLDEAKVPPDSPRFLAVGSVIRLGEAGPRFRIDEVSTRLVAPTVAEHAIASPIDKTAPMEAVSEESSLQAAEEEGTPASPTATIVLEEQRTGKSYKASGGRIRIGRGMECEVRPVSSGDTSVSRVHAEIVLKPDGRCVIVDARSRNGTQVNGRDLKGEHPLRMGDSVTLGDGGPELLVASLDLPERKLPPSVGSESAEVADDSVPPPPPQDPRRSFGGRGATVFMKQLVAEASRRTAGRTRKLVYGFVILLGSSVAGVYWYSELRVGETIAALEEQRRELIAQRQASDSLGRAAAEERERLSLQLEEARANAAPTAMLDSLRQELEAATQRTTDLAGALIRAQASMAEQLAAGEAIRQDAATELSRLRSELRDANASRVSVSQLDSLRQAIASAEQQVSGIEGRIRAVRGVDLAAVSQANQAAVGLVTAYSRRNFFHGSGFMISESGYFVTNRHVAMPNGRRADSVFVAMADQRFMRQMRIINVASQDGPDLALLHMRNYSGPYMERIDWSGTRASQGGSAALIGFPAGASTALDESQTVRTSMSAGIFSKVTRDEIQFDGFTVGGSSGSPIFNADGEVVAVHHSGLSESAGLGFAVPIRQLVPILPDSVRRVLGVR